MKLITAIVRQHKVELIKDALGHIGVSGMTVTDVRGFGAQGGHVETYRGTDYKISFSPKSRLEILSSDGDADKVIKAITECASTDTMGDGKIWVLDVERAVRVRTGEEGEGVL